MASTDQHIRKVVPAHQIQQRLSGTRDLNVAYPERMGSAIGGPLLALYGLLRGTPAGWGLGLLGGLLFYRGITGRCPIYRALGVSTAPKPAGPLHIEQSVTINKPADELYSYWRDFANLPRLMKHLEAVTADNHDRSHWVARGPAGTRVEWDAEITTDQPGRMICWRSLPNADVDTSGCVSFEPVPGGRGTLVHVSLDYAPPAGALGAAVARLFGAEPSQQIEDDLRRFKDLMEAGETTADQPSGQPSAAAAQPKKPSQPKKPPVQESSEESFPASDPPAWTGTDTGGEREVGGAG